MTIDYRKDIIDLMQATGSDPPITEAVNDCVENYQ